MRGLRVVESIKGCQQIWEVPLASVLSQKMGGHYHLDTLVSHENSLFVASRGKVRSFNVKTGALLWEQEPEGLNKGIFGAYDLACMVPSGDNLLITAANMLVCVKKSNGIQVWAKALDFQVKRDSFVLRVTPNNRVAVASLGWVACYDLGDGRLVWKNTLEVWNIQHLLSLLSVCSVSSSLYSGPTIRKDDPDSHC